MARPENDSSFTMQYKLSMILQKKITPKKVHKNVFPRFRLISPKIGSFFRIINPIWMSNFMTAVPSNWIKTRKNLLNHFNTKEAYSKKSPLLNEMSSQRTQKRFLDKVVIITGSSSGIGREAAVEFAKEGAFIVIHGQSAQKLDETEKLLLASDVPPGRLLKVIGSLEEREVPAKIINASLAKFGQIDILINNAGAGGNPSAQGVLDMDNLDYIMDVNFRSCVQLCLLALPHLEKTRGTILNISSMAGIRPFPPFLFYSCAKAAMDGWTKGFAQICSPRGVRINSLNPGPIDTPIFERNGIRGVFDQKMAKQTLLGRIGQTGEIASTMKFLCSDEAGYITGATLLADGGWTLNAGLD